MYSRILVPVDLAHAEKLTRALDTAAKIAGGDGATVIYTGVTPTAPSSVAHNPREYRDKLNAFAAAQSQAHGFPAEGHVIESHDVTIELANLLIRAAKETRADLVVMASHVPGAGDHVFHSHAGHVAAHAPVSVFVVR